MHEAKEPVEMIKKQFEHLSFWHTKTKFAYGSVNVNQSQFELVHACFTAAFSPNVNYIDSANGQYSIQSTHMENINPDRSSILSRNHFNPFGVLNTSLTNWIVYMDKTQGELNVRVQNAAIVSPMSVLLFSGKRIRFEETASETVVDIDDTHKFAMNPRIGNLVSRARTYINGQFDDILRFRETYGMVHEEGRKFGKFLCEVLKSIIT